MQDYLISVASRMGISMTDKQVGDFVKYYDMMIDYNSRFNLTRIVDKADAVLKHFADSLAGMQYIPNGAKCLDVGSGAGLPAIPLLIMRDDIHYTLTDSIGKKTAFLQDVVDTLSLNATVLNTRAEDLAKVRRESFDLVTARAVASMSPLCEYCLPLLKVGGSMMAYKTLPSEYDEGKNAVKVLGASLREIVPYTIPDSDYSRCLILLDKVRPTPPKYPREGGKARKSPL